MIPLHVRSVDSRIRNYSTAAEIREMIWGEGSGASRLRKDRRADNTEHNAKRRKLDSDGIAKPSTLPPGFSAEEIAAEARKPKHKVCVMVGYSGSGYKGMQINTAERTIEGDLFSAFVAAGAISKANADDPKKSSLVRCARTDKGVHAAGNLISLKLCDEIPDLVTNINAHLSSQIRVWGIQRTVNSFSCYQACDSRWYEYLIPTHSFLPPHPSSRLAKKLVAFADEVGDRQGYEKRQAEVSHFWSETEEQYIQPILADMDESIRELVKTALYNTDAPLEARSDAAVAMPADGRPINDVDVDDGAKQAGNGGTEVSGLIKHDSGTHHPNGAATSGDAESMDRDTEGLSTNTPANSSSTKPTDIEGNKRIEAATKSLRNAYISAKRTYRMHPDRLARIQPILDLFLGTHNFHNYTISKPFHDPSAKRVIKSFKVNPSPIIINGTEWLSLRVHGQSFMMHQIRKMIGMIALVIRCGCSPDRISESFKNVFLSIPKAPGLGLLLERPVFDSYNAGAAEKFGREKLDFGKYEKEMEEFKQKEIYQRIFREEEEANTFHTFFAQIDSFREPQFWYLSSMGLNAVGDTSKEKGKPTGADTRVDSESEADVGKGEEG